MPNATYCFVAQTVSRRVARSHKARLMTAAMRSHQEGSNELYARYASLERIKAANSDKSDCRKLAQYPSFRRIGYDSLRLRR